MSPTRIFPNIFPGLRTLFIAATFSSSLAVAQNVSIPIAGPSTDATFTITANVEEADAAIAQGMYDVAAARLTQAYDLLAVAQDPALEHLVLNSLGSLYYASNQPELAGEYYRKLIELDEQSGDDIALAISTYNMGHVDASQQQFVNAATLFNRSLDLSRELGDKSGMAYAYKALGVNAQAAGSLAEAEEMLNAALMQFSALGDNNQRATVLRNLGDVALERELPQQALSYYLQALPLLRESGTQSALIRTYRGLSQTYEQMHDYRSALSMQRHYDSLQQAALQQQGNEATVLLREQLDLRRYIDANSRLEQESEEQQQLLKLELMVIVLAAGCVVLLASLLWRGARSARMLHNLATTDELTKVKNRRAIFERGRTEWLRAQRYGQPVTCLALDVDFFKSINDTYGHAMGDTVLKNLTDTLGTMLRQTDSLGRIGGEEFLLVAGNTDLQQAQALAERIRAQVAAMTIEGLANRPVTISIGIAGFMQNIDFDQCVQRADKALYHAKHTGRNRCALYHPALDMPSAPPPSARLQPQLQLV